LVLDYEIQLEDNLVPPFCPGSMGIEEVTEAPEPPEEPEPGAEPALIPDFELLGPELVSSCLTLELQISNVTNAYDEPLEDVTWEVLSADPETDPPQAEVVAERMTFNEDRTAMSVSLLNPATTYVFGASVTNLEGGTNSHNISVRVKSSTTAATLARSASLHPRYRSDPWFVTNFEIIRPRCGEYLPLALDEIDDRLPENNPVTCRFTQQSSKAQQLTTEQWSDSQLYFWPDPLQALKEDQVTFEIQIEEQVGKNTR